MYAYRCTRTYVRVHFALFRPTLSIKRGSSTKINKTLIILTLLFSCRFLLPNLQDGSSAVLIQIRRLRYRRRTCICDQLPFFADHSATLWPSARLIFLLLFSHCFHCLRCWSLFSPGSAFIPHIRQNTAFRPFLPADWPKLTIWLSSFTANLEYCLPER